VEVVPTVMDIVELISNAFGAVKEFFGFQSKKLDLKNQAPVVAAAVAQDEVEARDKTRTAIANQNVKETRNELAE